MFELIVYPWMISNAYMLLIIYARVELTHIYIYSMLVLFIECWGSNLSIQVGVGKLNGDLHQPSGIRYVSISFSVIFFISLAYWEGIDFCGYSVCCGTPQAIGSFLHNKYLWWPSILHLILYISSWNSFPLLISYICNEILDNCD